MNRVQVNVCLLELPLNTTVGFISLQDPLLSWDEPEFIPHVRLFLVLRFGCHCACRMHLQVHRVQRVSKSL